MGHGTGYDRTPDGTWDGIRNGLRDRTRDETRDRMPGVTRELTRSLKRTRQKMSVLSVAWELLFEERFEGRSTYDFGSQVIFQATQDHWDSDSSL